MKKIDPRAYNALADALSVIYWNKKPWARYLRGVLRDAPEVLSGLDFEGDTTKRETAGTLVDRLMANEDKYQALAISLMLSVAEMEDFPNLASQSDSIHMIKTAEAAVAEVRKWTQRHQDIAATHERYAAEIAKASEDSKKNRAFSHSILKVKDQFMAMHQDDSDPHRRGIAFEGFINQLFGLFDLEPRAAYSLEREQIDGAFSFDTDDYILEARWRKVPVGREHMDVFAKKIERKGKNALGLFINVNGFTRDALDEYSTSTPFFTLDGTDFFMVLEERIRLEELLRRKKRHANETGDCYFPATHML
jgi:Restriction endonuclease